MCADFRRVISFLSALICVHLWLFLLRFLSSAGKASLELQLYFNPKPLNGEVISKYPSPAGDPFSSNTSAAPSK
jgi:hypothetical protein